MMKLKLTIAMLLVGFVGFVGFAKPYTLTSPDGRLKTEVNADKANLSYNLTHDGLVLVENSPIALDVRGVSNDFTVKKVYRKSVDKTFKTSIYKKAEVRDHYNELTLKFKAYSVEFRAYDSGMAYRFVANDTKAMIIDNELATFNFPKGTTAWISCTENKYIPNETMVTDFEPQFYTSHEFTYEHIEVKDSEKGHLSFMPMLVDGPEGKRVCITETALYNYPGLYFLNNTGESSLVGVFPKYPAELELGGHNMLQLKVVKREDYIARFESNAQFPWRVFAVSSKDTELLENDLAYVLAPETRSDIDFSFVKPGKVAWDWWNDWNLEGVDFRAGINNDTYKYYIDFAAKYGIEYVILDEGWATKNKGDLFDIIPEIDIPELVKYCEQKGVGLILWAGYYAFDKDMEKVCEHYSKMGIKGFKVDFMDRDDQIMVDFHHRAAEMTARYGLMIDFHGTYKPVGLHRTYPNVINYEGIHGLEQMKWRTAETDQVTYDVTVPFTRYVAGPADYTQGAMHNATRKSYYPCSTEPMSQGTRCHQLAEYVIFDAPLTMLCDSPSNYLREPDCTAIMASIPTVWDETRGLDGKVGEYVCTARRNGDNWYIGGLCNWDGKDVTIDLSFIPEGDYKLTLVTDGINADRNARDYKLREITLCKSLDVHMAPGGGFLLKIEKR